MHLLRRDIVDGDDEDALVLLEQLLELLEVSGLVFLCLSIPCLHELPIQLHATLSRLTFPIFRFLLKVESLVSNRNGSSQ